MSIFTGIIRELPLISVDNFEMKHNVFSTCFFLSHCHADHMKGIRDSPFLDHLRENENFILCCSDMSKLFLTSYPEFNQLYDQIIGLEIGLNEVCVPSRTFDGLSYFITVSCIPAGHCPGSVMFLFETPQHSILYTGDFRIAVGDVAKFQPLHDGQHVKKVDKIYIDATFFNPIYAHFLPRDESISIIVDEANKWLNASPRNMIRLDMTANYGGEFIMQSVSQALKSKIHVHRYIYKVYSEVPEVMKYLTNRCSTTRIHAQIRKPNHDCLKKVERDHILIIKPKAASFQCNENNKPITVIRKNKNYLEVNYSSHSSYTEIVDFVTYLKPPEVEICTETFKSSLNEAKERMSKIVSSYNNETEALKELKKLEPLAPYKPINLLLPSVECDTDSDSDFR